MPGFFDSKLPQMPAHASSQTFWAVVTCATLSVTAAPPAGLAAGALVAAAAAAGVGAGAAAVGFAAAAAVGAGGAGALVGAAGGALGAHATPAMVSPMTCSSCRRFIALIVIPLPALSSTAPRAENTPARLVEPNVREGLAPDHHRPRTWAPQCLAIRRASRRANEGDACTGSNPPRMAGS